VLHYLVVVNQLSPSSRADIICSDADKVINWRDSVVSFLKLTCDY